MYLQKSLPKKVTKLCQVVLLFQLVHWFVQRLARMQEMWFSFGSLWVAPPSSLTHVSFMANSPNLLGIAFICMHVKQACNSPDQPKS